MQAHVMTHRCNKGDNTPVMASLGIHKNDNATLMATMPSMKPTKKMYTYGRKLDEAKHPN